MPPEMDKILKDPVLSFSFESYLKSKMLHKHLLFIEAVHQIRYAASQNIEESLMRIFNTFFAPDAPMLLDVQSRDAVKEAISMYPLMLITKGQALEMLQETEEEVLKILSAELDDFLMTPLAISSMEQSLTKKTPMSSLQKHVVIIGGGFTGFTVASILDPMSLFYVTLIDTKDSFEYTPQIVEKIVNPQNCPSSLRFTHDSYIKNGRVIIGYAENITEDGKCVVVNGEKVYCDYLIIATGSSYTNQLKSTDSSSLYRITGVNDISRSIKKAKKILIIGAGLVGCELAAAIAQKKFNSPYPTKEITMVEALDRIVPRASTRQRQRIERFLKNLGVTIKLNESIACLGTKGVLEYRSSGGNTYSTQEYLVLIATGSKVNTGFLKNCMNEPSLEVCLDRTDHIRVKKTLQIDHWKYQHIFAGGDVTNVIEEKTGYAATLAGVCIARNICRLEKGKCAIPQGSKGLLPPPLKTLHGIKSQGGIGKEKLSFFKRKFSFLNPSWEMLKYFNEEQFFHIIQETSKKSNLIGRFPKSLELPGCGGMQSRKSSIVSQIVDSRISLAYESCIAETCSSGTLRKAPSVITL